MQILSNGKYKSIEHRAVIDTDKERLSIAAFHSPNLDAMIGPIPELITGKQARYKSKNQADYARLVASCKLDGKSGLDFMKF